MNYDNRNLSLSLKSNTLSQEKTILLIPVDNNREYLKLHIPEPDPLVKNNSFRSELLIPGDWFLHNDSVPFLTNLLLDICQKNKY
jgi:hypothetical protein